MVPGHIMKRNHLMQRLTVPGVRNVTMTSFLCTQFGAISSNVLPIFLLFKDKTQGNGIKYKEHLFVKGEDLNLFHLVNTRNDIFTRGYATRENIASGAHSMK